MRKKLLASMLLTITLIQLVVGYVLGQNFTKSDKRITRLLKKQSLDFKIDYLNVRDSKIRLLSVNHKGAKPIKNIFFIHGAPGSLTAFESYYTNKELLKEFNVYCVDRIGYGKSTQTTQIEIEEQAESFIQLIDQVKLDYSNTLLVSHSFGGAIAASMTYARPSFKAHLMLNPVISSKAEKIFWYSKIPLMIPFRWLSSNALISAALEKLAHPNQLSVIEKKYKHIKVPTVMYQSKKDNLAPIEHLQDAQELFDSAFFSFKLFEDQGHLLPFKSPELVLKGINDLDKD